MENSGELVHMPEEIINKILLRLPVESLFRFQCVCKSWRDLIQSAQFVESHRCTRSILLTSELSGSDVKENDVFDNLKKMNLSETMCLRGNYRIHGHCNGIICISGSNILLWNPALRQCRVLPPSPRLFTSDYLYRLGFGYDSANRDYKVVNVPCDTVRTSQMYSLKSNSWKPIQSNHLPFCCYISDRGCSFKGRLHWIGSSFSHRDNITRMCLVVFDLTGEKFLYFDIPEAIHKNYCYCLNLGVFKGCLSWLVPNSSSSEYEIWSSIDDSCRPESWTRVWKFTREALQLDKRLRVRLIQLTEDENVLVNVEYRFGDRFVCLYDVQMNGLKIRKRVKDNRFRWFPIINYVETLVSAMPETAIAPESYTTPR